MAKKFAGFKPETMHNKILPALGYNGPKDQKSINAFLAASPSAAAKMGKYTMVARQMVEGKRVGAFTGLFGGPKFGTPEYKELTAKTHAAALQAQKDKETLRSGSLADRLKVTSDPQLAVRGLPDASPSASGSNASMPSGGTAPATGLTTNPGGTSGDVNSANPTRGGGMPSGSNLTTQIGQDPTKPVTVANVVSTDGGSAALIPQNTCLLYTSPSPRDS